MTRDELKALLSAAGSKFDGHVTNGSIEAQMDVVWPMFQNIDLNSESDIWCWMNEKSTFEEQK